MSFPYFSNVDTERTHKKLSLEDIAEQIRNPSEKVKDLIALIKQEKDKDEKKRLKLQLPLLKFSSGSTLVRGSKKYTGFICYDFDHIPDYKLSNAFHASTLHPSVALSFISPSGDGLKVVIYDPRACDSSAKFKGKYDEIGPSIGLFIGCLVYDTTNDINRGCFLSFDPNVYVNSKPEPFEVGGRDAWAYNRISKLNADDYNDWYEAGAHYKGLVGDTGYYGWATWSKTADFQLSNDDLFKKWNDIHSTVEQNDAVQEYQVDFEYLLNFLKESAGIEFRWNADLDRPEVKANRDWGILELSQEFGPFSSDGPLFSHLTQYLQNNLLIGSGIAQRPYNLTELKFRHMYQTATQVQPMREHAQELMARIPKKTRRSYEEFVMQGLGKTLGITDGPLNTYVVPEFFVAVAVKMLYPDALVDWFPIFVGPEGCGKTLIFDELFPGYWRRYYNPSINLDTPQKDLMRALGGRVLGHIPEMAGAGRADVRRFKSFVSDLSFTDRMAYDRYATDMVSSWMLVGTANDDDNVIIPGDYNSRRIVVVLVDPPEPGYGIAHYVRNIREELLGSALHLAAERHENPHSVIPRDFREEQSEQNLPFSGQRIVADDLEEWLENGGREVLPLSVPDLYNEVYPNDITPSNYKLSNLKKAAIALGLRYHANHKTPEGKRIRVIKEA